MLFGGATQSQEQVAWLWPCNVEAWGHWCWVQTQWRSGMGGSTGLDYAGVRAYMDEVGITGPDRQELFRAFQLCERECLQEWAEQAKAKEANKSA